MSYWPKTVFTFIEEHRARPRRKDAAAIERRIFVCPFLLIQTPKAPLVEALAGVHLAWFEELRQLDQQSRVLLSSER